MARATSSLPVPLSPWMTTGKRPSQSVYVQPVGVIPRQSTDLMAVDDPEVVAALKFIRSHAGEPLKVNDVLKHVAMSRRSLEMHFQRAISRTIHEEIMRVRIEPDDARTFVRRARSLVASGRPPCPFCGEPLEPTGHFCVQQSGLLN